MPLNKLQKEAVEYLAGPLLVLAGPGTGKTQLLSSKVKFILENTDANPENILCVTFTDSGAENMRDRLRSMIGTAANRVSIHTYHSFGSSILAEYKNYGTEFPRNFDTPIDSVTGYKIISNIQKKLPAFDLLKTAKIRDIIDTISAAKSARLDSAALEKIADDNVKTAKKINQEVDPYLKNYQRNMKFDDGVSKIYLPIMEVLAKYSKKEPLVANIEREANVLLKNLNSIYETEIEKEKPSISPLTSWKNKIFELDENGNYRLKNRISNLKLASLAKIMKEYDSFLQESGNFDFADMIEQAILYLKTDTGFKATLAEKYQYILLDEYQDTNTAQAELISLLTDYESPIIMAVGDDDQAIYEFQGANASNLLNFQRHYNARVITLLENYRSNSEILDFSYQIREQINDSFAKQNKIEKRLSAFKKTGAKISRYRFVEASSEYAFVASKISELIKRDHVNPSEIAILTPQHKYVLPILPYLKSLNIDVAYEKRDNILEDKYIHELLTLAKFIYELSEEKDASHMLLEVLSFPFWNLEMTDIINSIQRDSSNKKTTLEYLSESKNEDLKTLAKFFAELVRASFNVPMELFLDYLIGTAEFTTKDGEKLKSNFLHCYEHSGTDYSTFELYSNLNVLREALRAHFSNVKTPKLKDLVAFIDDYELAGEMLVSTSPYQDSEKSVQIMTAHKAKGLEFEHVFLIAVDDRAWGNAKGNNNFLSLPINVASIRHTGVTEDERLRLFFVAATRAKSHLYMTNSLSDFAGKKSIPLEYLNEHNNEEEKLISPYLPASSQNVEDFPPQFAETLGMSNNDRIMKTWVSAYTKPDVNIHELLQKRLENYKITATDLTSFIDVAYGGPQEFYKEKVLRAPSESYSESISFGNLIHATFEKVTNEKLDDEEAIKFFKEQAISSPIPPEDLENILEKGEESLRTSLKSFSDILRSQHAKAEVNLYHEHLSLNDIPLTGKIDHININEENKTIEIYDFKTSGFKDNKWNSHPTLYKYRLQLGFYKLLLNLSPTYSKYKIERAHILFVVPDSENHAVHDKIYDYNAEDETELKDLIRAVYTHIKSLDFVENPDLFIPPDPEKGIKDIREFINLILDKNNKN